MADAGGNVLEITDLHLAFRSRGADVPVLGGVSLHVGPREIVGVVGESGSGKSVTALSVMGLLPPRKSVISAGSIRFQGNELLGLSEQELRPMRGRDMAMIFQEPMSALNPVKRISRQVVDVIRRIDRGVTPKAARDRALSLFADMRISEPERVFAAYPHELSGGLRQRVLIAMAFSSNPQLLIADEPTTALDVTTQAQILLLLKEQAAQKQTSIVFISHDLAVVADLCDRIYIMSGGRIVESGRTLDVIRAPSDAYTRKLLAVNPEGKPPKTRLTVGGTAPPPARLATRRADTAQDPLLSLDGVTVEFEMRRPLLRGPQPALRAVDGVSLTLGIGETLSIVGESGSGKTTLAKAVVGMVPLTAGSMSYAGRPLAARRELSLRREIQMVFQDPQSSLNPRHPAWRLVTEPARIADGLSKRDCLEKAAELLELVGLSSNQLRRLPHEFSGGQRQRLAVARALSVQPRLLVLDEPTSALDVSVQAQILDLLLDLQASRDLSYLFISHDVTVVRHMSDRVAVMHRGKIVETGVVAAVLDQPKVEYTRTLVASVPTLESRTRG